MRKGVWIWIIIIVLTIVHFWKYHLFLQFIKFRCWSPPFSVFFLFWSLSPEFFITFHFFSRLRRVLIYRLFQSYIGWLFGTNLDVMTYRSHKVWNFNLYSKQLNESCIKNGNLFDFWIQKMSPNGIPVPPVVLERTPTRGEIVPVEVLTVYRQSSRNSSLLLINIWNNTACCLPV